jgi:tRNA threonylcarbamoyladenosine biosynthesis protein TsaB
MQANPLILALETATLGGSICLARGLNVLASRTGDPKTSHSNTLLRDISDLLTQTAVAISDVELFAAAIGPGSFTGLRIGLATVKALAATTGRFCAGVPTLQAVAAAAGPSEATVALLPAGRGEVFAQLFSVTVEGETRKLDKPVHVSPARLLERYGAMRTLLWAGEGAHIYRELIEQQARARSFDWAIATVENNLSCQIATLGLQQYLTSQLVSPESLQALYVRPSDAEINVVNK